MWLKLSKTTRVQVKHRMMSAILLTTLMAPKALGRAVPVALLKDWGVQERESDGRAFKGGKKMNTRQERQTRSQIQTHKKLEVE